MQNFEKQQDVRSNRRKTCSVVAPGATWNINSAERRLCCSIKSRIGGGWVFFGKWHFVLDVDNRCNRQNKQRYVPGCL